MKDERFGKEYKLCSKKTIAQLFKEGERFHSFPFSVTWMISPNSLPVPFQVVFSVPKRLFKRAHDRNHIKRLMREVLRKNKALLEEKLNQHEVQLLYFMVYTQKELPTYQELDKSCRKLLHKLGSAIESKDKS